MRKLMPVLVLLIGINLFFSCKDGDHDWDVIVAEGINSSPFPREVPVIEPPFTEVNSISNGFLAGIEKRGLWKSNDGIQWEQHALMETQKTPISITLSESNLLFAGIKSGSSMSFSNNDTENLLTSEDAGTWYEMDYFPGSESVITGVINFRNQLFVQTLDSVYSTLDGNVWSTVHTIGDSGVFIPQPLIIQETLVMGYYVVTESSPELRVMYSKSGVNFTHLTITEMSSPNFTDVLVQAEMPMRLMGNSEKIFIINTGTDNTSTEYRSSVFQSANGIDWSPWVNMPPESPISVFYHAGKTFVGTMHFEILLPFNVRLYLKGSYQLNENDNWESLDQFGDNQTLFSFYQLQSNLYASTVKSVSLNDVSLDSTSVSITSESGRSYLFNLDIPQDSIPLTDMDDIILEDFGFASLIYLPSEW